MEKNDAGNGGGGGRLLLESGGGGIDPGRIGKRELGRGGLLFVYCGSRTTTTIKRQKKIKLERKLLE